MLLTYNQFSVFTVLFIYGIPISQADVKLQNINIEWESKYEPDGIRLSAMKIVHSDGKLLTVQNYEKSTGDDYFILINTIYPPNINSTCKIPSVKNRFIGAVSLGNGKIVTWMSNDSVEAFFIINAVSCSHKTFSYDKGVYAVFPYHETFDIVDYGDRCPTGDGCAYRYNEEGALIGSVDSILLWSYFVNRRFDMFKKYSPNDNYFVIRKLSGYKTAIDVLDKNLKYNCSYSFDHPIESYSTAHRNFGLCYTKYDHDGRYDQILKCRFLDWNFNATVNATDIKHTEYIRSIAMHNLPGGGAIIVYSIPRYVGTSHVYYRHIDASGKTGNEDILIEEFNSEDVNIYIHEVSAVDRNYCILLSADSSYAKGKCVNVPMMI